MNFNLLFNDRSLYDVGMLPQEAKFRVNSYSWSVKGGPKEASISVRGTKEQLWRMLGMLRCPVNISAGTGEEVWWGYVHGVTIRYGRIEITASLNSMYNRVMASYSYKPSGLATSRQATTSWYQDDISVATYGTREARISLSNASDEAAVQSVLTYLEDARYPGIDWGSSGADVSLSANLTCKGWSQTLGWTYYNQAAGSESHQSPGGGVQNLGSAAGNSRARESFQIASPVAWTVTTLSAKVRKEGGPSDTVRLTLTNASGGELAHGDVDSSTISTSYAWLTATLNTPVVLQPGTVYYVVVSRTGGVSATDYYRIDVDEGLGYTSGSLTIWNGSSWVTRSPDADLLFLVGGVQETSAQIVQLLDQAGQFLKNVRSSVSSGVLSNPYRDGQSAAGSYLDDLLEGGTIRNRRMLYTIDKGRNAIVYEEPQPSGFKYYVDEQYVIRDLQNQPYRPYTPYICGQWVRTDLLIPASVNTAKLGRPDRSFIEECSYDTGTNEISLTSKNQITLGAIGRIRPK